MSTEILSPDDAFELQMVHQDMLADAVFLIGTLISISENNRAEREIVSPGENQPSGMNAAPEGIVPFGLGVLVLVLFLVGTAIFAFTTSERLDKQKAEAGDNPDQTTVNNIKGGEMVIFGQLIRIIGYSISIMGENIRNANPV